MITRELLHSPQALKNIKVAVLGLGVSNIPVVRFLNKYGAQIVICDKRVAEKISVASEFKAMGHEFFGGEDYLKVLTERKFDVVVRTPGIRPDCPEILAALAAGAHMTSEIELVFDLASCPIVAVTGSDGKTTTTTLIAEMLRESGITTHCGGNIGKPLIEEVLDYSPEDIIVLELSSFQLMTMKQSPPYSLITNLSPNHLNWHLDYQEYVAAKLNIAKCQTPENIVVLNADNQDLQEITGQLPGKILLFSRQNAVNRGACIIDGMMVLRRPEGNLAICKPNELQLLGLHNVENVLAAAALAYEAGASIIAIRKVAREFTGVEHRLEKVRVLKGITFYNDSIASSPTRALAAIESFESPMIIIAGGSDKYVPFDEFAEAVAQKVKALVLLGQTAQKIEDATRVALAKNGRNMPMIHVQTLEEAVQASYRLAETGDVISLSPACASFDMFDNFVQRGRLYKEYVNKLD